MFITALIVAAGSGARFGSETPKQYHTLAGRSVLAHAVGCFRAAPSIARVVIVVRPGDAAPCRELLERDGAPADAYVDGGETRQASVHAGLEALAADAPPEAVLIHDAARPNTPPELIARVVDALSAAEAVCPALPVVDTLRSAEGGVAGDLVPRDGLWRAQTPQGFRFPAILAAHRAQATIPATDDAEIARRAGLGVRLVEGSRWNEKITAPGDLEASARILEATAMREIRTGLGYDVHKFGPNADGSTDHVMLCGVRIPHDDGLVGHSDADVGLHALTDAVLGAFAGGDIGRHFPPSDPQWRGATSDRFLRFAAERVSARGGAITHLDLVLICERPKISPHADAMRARVAEIASLSEDRVSIKATTSEGLGFTGRREGIAAQAIATLSLPAQR